MVVVEALDVLRIGEVLEILHGVEPRAADVREHHVSLFSDEERAARRQLEIAGELRLLAGGLHAGVGPREPQRGAGGEFRAGKGVTHGLACRPDVAVDTAVVGADRERRGEAECGEHGIEDVGAKIAERTAAEVLPVAPRERVINVRCERPHWRATEPQIPVDALGHRAGGGRLKEARAFVAGDAQPRVDFLYLADHAVANEPRGEAIFDGRVNLVSHLGDDALLLRPEAQLAAFPHGVREGLFAVDVLAAPHRCDGSERVHVVGRGDDHGVHGVAEFFEHDAEVCEVRRARMVGVGLGKVRLIDVAERDELRLRVRSDAVQVAVTASIDADRGKLDAAVGIGGAQHGREAEGRASERGVLEKGAARGRHGNGVRGGVHGRKERRS